MDSLQALSSVLRGVIAEEGNASIKLRGLLSMCEMAEKIIKENVQKENKCTRPDLVDCHAKVGTDGRCMNAFTCPSIPTNEREKEIRKECADRADKWLDDQTKDCEILDDPDFKRLKIKQHAQLRAAIEGKE